MFMVVCKFMTTFNIRYHPPNPKPLKNIYVQIRKISKIKQKFYLYITCK